jgi:hypothetical protein
MSVNTHDANRRSAEVRRQRVMLHHYVLRGGSLTLLLRDGAPGLDGVPLHRLATWPRGFGDARAQRILYGLPSHKKWGDLTSEQANVFINRVARFERMLIARRVQSHQEKQHAH